MIHNDILRKARAGDDYACGMLYALTEADPVRLTELGEDIADAVNAAHERALNRLNDQEAALIETNRLLQARLDREQSRRENWDDDWSPLPADSHGKIAS